MIPLGPGLHRDVPMDVYHGNCCPGPSVSGSVLFTLHETCPARALASHYLSPWPREDDDTPATSLGTAAHTLILEGAEAFSERYAIKPDDYDGRTKDGKAWRAANEGKEFITAADFARLTAMRQEIENHPTASRALAGGQPEMTAVVQDSETGLWLKARPDYLRKGLAINFKTTKDASDRPWMFDAAKLGYHVSAALAIDVLKALDHPAHYLFLAQEKEPPFLIAPRVLADDFIMAGRMTWRRAARKFADCLAAGKWDGYGDEVSTVPCPPWLDKQLTDAAPL